ncbi:CAH9 anhydrase, partial [Sula dactylatra]|nr:CAH9 anhydrase [Sula dactylatra]
CAGTMQSPINIDMTRTIFSPQLQLIQLSGYSLPANEKLKLRNSGHTGSRDVPDIFCCMSRQTFSSKCFQKHAWAALMGERGHWDRVPLTGSDSSPLALPSPLSLCSAPVLVISVWSVLQVGPRENPYYQEILEHLYKIQREGKEILVPGFNIAGLLPANLKLYFYYSGSLTILSCYQMVKWTVFNQTMLISHDQMSVLVTILRNNNRKPLQNNFRLVQDLHGQQVLASFQTTLLLAKQLPSGSNGSAAAGDVLAVLFGVFFAIMALAFL